MEEIAALSALELLDAYRHRSLSPVEVLDTLAARIEELNPSLCAFITLCLDRARVEATRTEADYGRGECAGPLAGLPFGVKDLFDSAGVRTTYGSPMFSGHVPAADAEAVRRARGAGAILVGKTQTHEFAWGITSVNEAMGTSRNPWAPDRISGGSSGGSAVALATDMVPLAMGSDTGGSIRVPSSFCGTVGCKPSYARIASAGLFPLAPSLDHPGPMARTPADAALLFGVLTDRPSGDSAIGSEPADLHGTRIGLCADLHLVPLAPEIQDAFDAAVDAAAGLGAQLIEVSLPEATGAYAAFSQVQPCEVLQTHTSAGLYPARREEYGSDVRGRLDFATTLTLADYLEGTVRREKLRAGFDRVFDEVDLVITPVTAGPPAPIGHERVMHLGEEIEFRELVMSYTTPQDLAGLPACTVRAGFDALGVPTAVQLTGPAFGDQRVLGAAQALYEATAELQRRRPDSVAGTASS
ncbi:MAG TPA: amidase [Solirubrobacteraceae bacterium]|nr:amidase [Solirubrobacteraceae bacterium]